MIIFYDKKGESYECPECGEKSNLSRKDYDNLFIIDDIRVCRNDDCKFKVFTSKW